MDTLTLATQETPADACRAFLEVLARDHRLLAVKAYRVELPDSMVPVVPCLDHEAHLQGHFPAHVSVYLEDGAGDLHEVGFVPSERRVLLDCGATLAETTPEARRRMLRQLEALFPHHTVRHKAPSVLRGDSRVASVVRAQLRLREVLCAEDTSSLDWRLEQLRAIADLMEKESRVSSWAVRTLTTPVLAAAGVSLWWVLGLFARWLDASQVAMLRYGVLGLMGGGFLWVGLKAVHLTEMGTRVWKRATEYRLIIKARERLAKAQTAPPLRSVPGER